MFKYTLRARSKKILFFSFFILFLPILGNTNTKNTKNTKVSYIDIDKNKKKISVQINLENGDFAHKDHISISVDHPEIELSEWHTDIEPVNYFSKEFRENKQIFDKNFTINFEASKKATNQISITDAHIHLVYYLNSKKGMVEEIIPFPLSGWLESPNVAKTHRLGQAGQEEIETHVNTSVVIEKNKEKSKEEKKTSWTKYLQDLVKTTESTWARILLALLLGILLSLTPCIYPMIPITVGILQAQGSKSVLHNFFLSLVYVMGIAITFAILGLIAAFTGQIFGSILSNPIFVIIVVIFLIYLAFSMLGLYEMYIPRFMQSSGGPGAKKSIVSIFIFGLVSGSIASPCVSPGLVLLLSIVTAIGNKFLGFLLLFAFGLGLGAPLLIVGTFSGAINKLPKAGMWMLEIKKIFGLLLFGVCFYFLSNILPWNIVLWIMAGFMFSLGAFYLYSIAPYDTKFWKIFKNIIGIGLITLSIITLFNAYKETYLIKKQKIIDFWENNYEQSLARAKKENKKLFLDFGAAFCSNCKAIEKKVFQDQKIINLLKKIFINVKIDGTDPSSEPFATLKKKYNIMGFPTFLLIDPSSGTIIKKWSSEFYTMPNQEIIDLFNKL